MHRMVQLTARETVLGAIAAASVLVHMYCIRRRYNRWQEAEMARRIRLEYPPRCQPPPTEAAVDLSGKVVLITGAAQGLGLACARSAHAAGVAALVLCDRNAERGLVAAQELEACGCECMFVRCDVGVPAQVSAAVAKADARFGRIDCLVNAAGDTRRAELDSTSVELFDALIAVNLRAPFLFTQAVSRIMRREGRGGAVVNVASVQAAGGLTCCMAYAAAKGGLLTLTRNNAAALGPHGIKVNALNMGWTATDNEHALQLSLGQGPEWLASADRVSAIGRICRPDDVARAVVFLLAGAHCTGSVLELHPEHIPGMLGAGVGAAK
jgi:NAD(P)-dependent dehydrogenase (short-subunit alcohol dehydrogenase family)